MARQWKEGQQPKDQEVGGVKRISEVVKYADLTDQGGAYGTVDLGETLPDGAFVVGSRARVITAFDGTNPDITVGTSSDVDRFQKGSEVGIGSTGEKDLGTANGQNATEGDTTVQVRIGEDTDFANISKGVVHVQVLYL